MLGYCSKYHFYFTMLNKNVPAQYWEEWRSHCKVVYFHIQHPGRFGEPRYLHATPRKFCRASLWSCWLYFWNKIITLASCKSNRIFFFFYIWLTSQSAIFESIFILKGSEEQNFERTGHNFRKDYWRKINSNIILSARVK